MGRDLIKGVSCVVSSRDKEKRREEEKRGEERTQPYLEMVPNRVSLNTYLSKGPPSIQAMKVWARRRSLRELERDTLLDKHCSSQLPF